MDANEILACALETLREPEHWIQHTMARKADYSACETLDPDATMFCMAGAIGKCSGYSEGDLDAANGYRNAINKVTEVLPKVATYAPWSITSFNDHTDTTHEDVVAVFEKALETP